MSKKANVDKAVKINQVAKTKHIQEHVQEEDTAQRLRSRTDFALIFVFQSERREIKHERAHTSVVICRAVHSCICSLRVLKQFLVHRWTNAAGQHAEDTRQQLETVRKGTSFMA